MIKQFLGKLPRKPSKSSDNREFGGLSGPAINPYASSRSTGLENIRPVALSNTSPPGPDLSFLSGYSNGTKPAPAMNPRSNGNSGTSSYELLPLFRDVVSSEKQNLFIRKLNMCCLVFDFTDPTKNLKEKDIKRKTLLELVDYVTSVNGKFTENTMQEVVKMVAERSLYLWNNDHIENLTIQNRKVILPIIFPALERNGCNHWNQLVQSLTVKVHKIFSDHDPKLFEECLCQFQENEVHVVEIKAKHEAAWKHVEEIAANKCPGKVVSATAP